MAEDYIKQLKSVDSKRRREAILALGKSVEPDALEALHRAARTDPDFMLRQLAAGFLRAPANTVIEPAQQPPLVIKPLEHKAPPPTVSDQTQKQARECLTRAFEHRVKREIVEAIGELARALVLDPALATDSTALSLAMSLTGLPADQALLAVKARGKNWEVRRKRTAISPDAVRFVLEAIVLYLILLVAITTFSAGFISAMNKLFSAPSTPAAVATEMGSVFARLKPADLLISLPIAFVALSLMMFWASLIYVIGIAMGGTGAALNFLRTLLSVQIVAYILTLLSQAIVVVAVLTSVANTIPQAQALAWVSLSLSGLCLAGMFVGQAYFAGRIHGIGLTKGFISTLFATIIFGFFWVVLGIISIRR